SGVFCMTLAKKLITIPFDGNNKGCLVTFATKDVHSSYPDGLNDPEVSRFLVTVHDQPQTLSTIKNFVESNYNSIDSLLFAIKVENEVNPIGTIRLHAIEFFNYSAHIGLCIFNKKYWGKGIGSAAINALTKWSFTELGLRWLEAGIYEDNFGSRKAFEKANYKLSHKIADKYLFNGQPQTVNVFVAKNENWMKRVI
ncbi:MAG: GNAT family N-acetyltransferase, partial [Romboutsia sp.]|nr:GNAT family N-acetyltransferase [Romboutsia sp.]